MQIGKLTNEQLNRMLMPLRHTREEVLMRPGVGIDCSVLKLHGALTVLSTDPVTAAGANLAKLTLNVCCNDAAAAGARPVGVLVTLLAPPSAEEETLLRFARELAEEAECLGVEIIGGHTEITDAVTRLIASATVVGDCDRILSPANMRPGDALILTKWAGMEGTAILAHDYADRLTFLSEDELAQARALLDRISVLEEGRLAWDACAMHDVTEGGVLGAVWELAQAAGIGVELDRDAIPILDVTRKICGALGLDPLRLIASGSMLIAARNETELLRRLDRAGIPARRIGRAVASGVCFLDGEDIPPPEADEIYRAYEKLMGKNYPRGLRLPPDK